MVMVDEKIPQIGIRTPDGMDNWLFIIADGAGQIFLMKRGI